MTAHFTRPLTEASLEPVTYDSPLSVTLSLSDWNNIQTYLWSHQQDLMKKGRDYEHGAKKVGLLLSRLNEQTIDGLCAAAADAEERA